MKISIPTLIVLAGLAAGLALALVPNTHGALYAFLPAGLRRWVAEHDDPVNIIAFLTLSIFALCFQREPRRVRADTKRNAVLRLFESRGVRAAALMALVCTIELVQFFIPGRVADLQDVCTGWSGIFAAWLIAVLLDARAERSVRVAAGSE